MTPWEPRHTVRLNDDFHDRIVPEGCDVTGIHLDFPEGLERVELWIQGTPVAAFDASMQSDLATFPVYLSAVEYVYADLVFVYDMDWIRRTREYGMIDEYVDEVTYGEEVEIEDSDDECHVGRVVHRRSVQTGRQVRVATREARATVPEVRLDVRRGGGDARVEVPVKHLVNARSMDAGDLKNASEKHGLTMRDETTAWVDDILVYTGGFAGLVCAWAKPPT